MIRTVPVLFLAGALTIGAGCTEQTASAPPPVAPAEPMKAALPAPPVRSAMWSIASKTNRVAELLQKEPPPLVGADLQEVKTLVDDVAKIAAGLSADPVAQRHPAVAQGLPDFKAALVMAQAGLAKDPADTAPASALGAQCLSCHGQGKTAPPFQL